MRVLSLVLVMAVGATIAVYTPLKDFYPPRHEVFAFAAETVPELRPYIPSALLLAPDKVSVDTGLPKESEGTDSDSVAPETSIAEPLGLRDRDAEIVWTAFRPDQLRILLNEMGYPTDATVSPGDEDMLMVKRANGLDFGLVLKICEDAIPAQSCGALQIAAIVFQDIDEGVLASMNQRHDGMKFAKLDGGDLQITRYMIAESGIARGNVKANIADFVDILDLYMGTG